MDVAYIFRKGAKDSIALRYSLRGLKNVPHDRVYLVGDKPSWIRDIIHIPVKDFHKVKSYRGRMLNVWEKVGVVCDSDISEDFIFFNDDFYVLKKVSDFPYYYRGGARRFVRPNAHQKTVLRATSYFKEPLDFCTHTPLVYNKEKMIDLYNHYDVSKGVNMRTLYCNHYKVKPLKKIGDVKIRDVQKLRSLGGRTFLSTFNKIELNFLFEKEMNKIFPKKSNYENG